MNRLQVWQRWHRSRSIRVRPVGSSGLGSWWFLAAAAVFAATVASAGLSVASAGAAVETYTFPIHGCSASYARSHHDYPATDIFAGYGCRFVAPITGRVDEVSRVDHWSPGTNRGADRGGLSVSIVGVDGVRYYGSHLSRIAAGIKPGLYVRWGATLGFVGRSGDASATHLHFGISWPTPPGKWWVRRGEVWPWRYLDAWRSGQVHRSPVTAVHAAWKQAGRTVPKCRVDC